MYVCMYTFWLAISRAKSVLVLSPLISSHSKLLTFFAMLLASYSSPKGNIISVLSCWPKSMIAIRVPSSRTFRLGCLTKRSTNGLTYLLKDDLPMLYDVSTINKRSFLHSTKGEQLYHISYIIYHIWKCLKETVQLYGIINRLSYYFYFEAQELVCERRKTSRQGLRKNPKTIVHILIRSAQERFFTRRICLRCE